MRAPLRKRAAEDFGFLSEGELALLLRAVPQRLDRHGQLLVQDLRDKALLALMSLQVLRTVEITRANTVVSSSGRCWCAARATPG